LYFENLYKVDREDLFVESRQMNAFDKHHKRITAWCEECDAVFDSKWMADAHKAESGHHNIRITEFLITTRR
jgi:hypothetical protein